MGDLEYRCQYDLVVQQPIDHSVLVGLADVAFASRDWQHREDFWYLAFMTDDNNHAHNDQPDHCGTEELFSLVYTELRTLAARELSREQPGQTLDATGLVHEAYLRLADVGNVERWDNKRHFFAAAAQAMRRILVDRARQKLSLKRGGGRNRQRLQASDAATAAPSDEIVAVDDALDALADEDSLAAELVKLRYFAGFSIDEAAEILQLSRASAYRIWAYARAWLRASLDDHAINP